MRFTNDVQYAILTGIGCMSGVFGLAGISFVARIYPNRVRPADGMMLSPKKGMDSGFHQCLVIVNAAADLGIRLLYSGRHYEL